MGFKSTSHDIQLYTVGNLVFPSKAIFDQLSKIDRELDTDKLYNLSLIKIKENCPFAYKEMNSLFPLGTGSHYQLGQTYSGSYVLYEDIFD